MEKPLILVVDDEDAIRSALSTFLSRIGFRVILAPTAEKAEQLVDEHEPDLILLDVVLNESDPNAMSGIDLLRTVRQRERFVPVIMLTSYPEWQVESLGQGAIAFITKPWVNNALAGQIRATLGAISQIRAEVKPAEDDSILLIAPFTRIDLAGLRVVHNNREVDLTPIEFALLAFFARNPNRYWTREELLDRVWGYDWDGYPRTVDRHIAALRRKLKLSRNEMIETVHGVGYRLVAP
ncbi:MAG: response regulator transcription factor [Chloroflexota bacterium]